MANGSEHTNITYLETLKAQYGSCTRCEAIVPHRRQIVWGAGPNDAMIMVIAEAPGEEEDAQGEHYTGASGQTLSNLFEQVGLSKEAVYITNTVMCRPTSSGEKGRIKNRTPSAAEKDNCRDRLISEILYVDPLIILALGAPAATNLLGKHVSLESIRGQINDIRFMTVKGIEVKYPMVATFHPAYLMQYAKPNELFLAIKDMELLRNTVLAFAETIRNEREGEEE